MFTNASGCMNAALPARLQVGGPALLVRFASRFQRALAGDFRVRVYARAVRVCSKRKRLLGGGGDARAAPILSASQQASWLCACAFWLIMRWLLARPLVK